MATQGHKLLLAQVFLTLPVRTAGPGSVSSTGEVEAALVTGQPRLLGSLSQKKINRGRWISSVRGQ